MNLTAFQRNGGLSCIRKGPWKLIYRMHEGTLERQYADRPGDRETRADAGCGENSWEMIIFEKIAVS